VTPHPTMQQLFAGAPLSQVLAEHAYRATLRLADWPAAELLSTPPADAVEQLIKLARVTAPCLERGNAWLEPPAEVAPETVSSDKWAPAVIVTIFTLVIPVTGDRHLLTCSPSRLSGGPVEVEALTAPADTVRLVCDDPGSAEQARAYFEEMLDQIELQLEGIRADIQAHNQQMAKEIPAAVARRGAKLLRDRNLAAGIGYPILK